MLKLWCYCRTPRSKCFRASALKNKNNNNNKAETVATQAIAVAKGGKHLRQDKTVFDFPPMVEKVAGEFKANQGITFDAPLKTAL